MDHTKQSKYLDLRNKLNQYQYDASFGIESYELVEWLFRDVVTATGSYRELQEKELRLANDLSLAQAQLFPLRKENARLVKENHQLHLDSVKKSDQFDEYIAKHLQAAKAATDENHDLQIKYMAKEDQLKQKEQELERLKEAYERLLNSSSRSLSSTKRSIKSSYQITKADSDESKSDYFQVNFPSSSEGDSEIINTLRQKLSEAESTIKELESIKHRLTTSLASRDEEFIRLTKLVNTPKYESPSDMMNTGSYTDSRTEQILQTNQANKRIIDQLNSQIDFLNEQLAIREDQVVKTADVSHELNVLQADHKQLLTHHEDLKLLNAKLVGQVQALEKKLTDLDQALDPEGDVTVDQLVFGSQTSHETAVASEDASNKGKTFPQRSIKDSKLNAKKYHTAPVPSKPTISTKQSTKSPSQTSQVDSLLSKFATEKTSLSEEIHVLQGRMSNLQVNENLLIERLRRSEERIKALKGEVEVANGLLESSKKQLLAKDHEISRLTSQLNDLNDAYKALNDHLLEEENNKATLESKSYNMERSLNDTINDREKLLDMINVLKNDLKSAKSERQEAVLTKEKLERSWSSMERDVDSYRKALEDLNSELREAKHSVIVSGIQIEDLEAKLESQQRVTSLVEADLHSAKSELDKSRQELRDASQKLVSYQSSLVDADAYHQLREDMKDLRRQLNEHLDEKQRLIRERDNLISQLKALSSTEDNRRLLDSQIQQQQASMNRLLEEKDHIINSLTQQNLHLEHEMELMDHEIKDREQAYGSVSASAREKEALISQRQESFHKLQSEYNLLMSRYSDEKLSNANLSNQNQSLSSNLSRVQDRLSESDKENRSLKEQIAIVQGDYDQLKLEYDNIKRHFSSLERRQEISRDDIHIAQEEKESLSLELSQLRSLVSTMEISAKSQQAKIQQLLSNLDDEIESGKDLCKTNERLNERINELTRELQDRHRTMQLLDEERDHLQAEYDDKVGALRKYDEVKTKLESQCLQLRQLVDSLEIKLSDATNDLATSQRHHASYESRIQALVDENNELKKRLKAKVQEVTGAAHDLNLMTQENQALTSELASSSSECENLRQRLSEVLSINSQSEQMKRALEMERDDLLETYRTVLVDKRKLENDMVALGSMKQKAGLSAQHSQNEVAELKGVINGYEASQQRWLSERSVLHKQLEKMSDEIKISERKVEAIEADNRRVIQEMYGMKQTNSMLNERMQLLLKRINEITESNKIMSNRISSLEKERDALSRLLGIERQKVVDMSKLVENTRSQLAAKEHELKRLREDLNLTLSPERQGKSRPTMESLKKDMTLSPSASSYVSLSSDAQDPSAKVNSSFQGLAAAMRNVLKQDSDILSNLGLSADDNSDTEDSL